MRRIVLEDQNRRPDRDVLSPSFTGSLSGFIER
jgi:hypothetical protein